MRPTAPATGPVEVRAMNFGFTDDQQAIKRTAGR
jgi:hypothetical protein